MKTIDKTHWIKESLEAAGAVTASTVSADYKRLHLYRGADPAAIVKRICRRQREGEPPLKGKTFTVRMICDEYLVGEYLDPQELWMKQLEPHLHELAMWFCQNIEVAPKTRRFLERVSIKERILIENRRLGATLRELGVSLADWKFTETEYLIALACCLFRKTKESAEYLDRGVSNVPYGGFAVLAVLVECAQADGFQVDPSAQRIYDYLGNLGRSDYRLAPQGCEDVRPRPVRRESAYALLTRLCGPDASDDVDFVPEQWPAHPLRPARRASALRGETYPEHLLCRVAELRNIERNATMRLISSQDMVALAGKEIQAGFLRHFDEALEDLHNCLGVDELPIGPTPFAVLDAIVRWNQLDLTDYDFDFSALLRGRDVTGLSFTPEEKAIIEAFRADHEAWHQQYSRGVNFEEEGYGDEDLPF